MCPSSTPDSRRKGKNPEAYIPTSYKTHPVHHPAMCLATIVLITVRQRNHQILGIYITRMTASFFSGQKKSHCLLRLSDTENSVISAGVRKIG